jgi:hypothetical protein
MDDKDEAQVYELVCQLGRVLDKERRKPAIVMMALAKLSGSVMGVIHCAGCAPTGYARYVAAVKHAMKETLAAEDRPKPACNCS